MFTICWFSRPEPVTRHQFSTTNSIYGNFWTIHTREPLLSCLSLYPRYNSINSIVNINYVYNDDLTCSCTVLLSPSPASLLLSLINSWIILNWGSRESATSDNNTDSDVVNQAPICWSSNKITLQASTEHNLALDCKAFIIYISSFLAFKAISCHTFILS